MVAVVLLVAGVITSPGGDAPGREARQEWSARIDAGNHAGLWLVGGAVVTAERNAVVARSPHVGAVLWQVPLAEPHCSSDGVRLVCVPSGRGADDGTITLIDSTGSSTSTRVPGAQLAGPLGGDLIVAGGTGRGERWLARLAPDGHQRWRSTLAEPSSAGTSPTFHELAVSERAIIWWFGENGSAYPEPGMVEPASGERMPTLSAAPYTPSLPLAFERTLMYLDADARASEDAPTIMLGGVADSIDEPWLWRWEVDETPIGVTDDAVISTISADRPSDVKNGDPWGYATIRTRAAEGSQAQESRTTYRSISCPCTWAGSALVAHGLRASDLDALQDGDVAFDVVLLDPEHASVAGRHPLAGATWPQPAMALAADDERAFLLTGGEVVALSMP
ncbi:hypothetical protein SAMN04488554_0126 [Ruania alba]|uniref:Uncharacterized protein n=2 Tax=Ruania alba TaxID=648782 RepID=A0A1H5BJL1_9MICO|nr:hypothetical protein SAMN04488554_0126 [Ruania alba]